MVLGLPALRGTTEDLLRAQDPTVKGQELLPLAVHRDAKVRAVVAARPDCPMGALIALGHDTDSRVLEALVRNIRTPSSVIRSLAESRNRGVAQLALSRLQHSFR